MSLHYPWLLALLLLIPPLLWLRYGRLRQPTLSWSTTDQLAQLPPTLAVRLHRLLPLLYTLALIALIVAIARPRRGLAESKVYTDAVDIVLLVDVSTSMNALDAERDNRNRLDIATDVIKQFVERRPHDRIGVVAFSGAPYTMAPLTLAHGWVLEQIDRLRTGMLEDGTGIGKAIASATNRLLDSEAQSKIVILLTDGVNTDNTVSPINTAQAAKALGIKIYTVGAGRSGLVRMPGPDGFAIRQNSEIDTRLLQEIADITQARFFRAEDYDALRDVYAEIDRMEKTEMEVEHFTRYQELFVPIATLALGLLLAEKLLSHTRLGRLL